MSKNKILTVGLVILSLCTKFTVKAQDMLNYKISILHPQTHYAKISIELKASTDDLHFTMPSWTPGSYLMREFAKSVDRVKASINGISIPLTKTAKGTWTVSGVRSKKVLLEYDLYAFELSVRTSFIDADQAFLHNTSVFMLVEECKNETGQLVLDYPSAWKEVSTSLDTMNGAYVFENYDELADAPIQIGNQTIFHFEVAGVPHEVAMVGPSNADEKKLSRDMQRMCQIMTDVIGEHPCKKYVFIVHNVESGGGGLEHKNSCTVMMPRWSYTDLKKYHSFLGLVAHEYFHLWNVKRIRPAALGPFDYANENHTNLLWVGEGITSYYDEMSLYLFGYYDKQTYLDKLAGYIERVENQPGSQLQSLSESSWDAWIKAYRSNENSANTGISYYTKGLVIAMLLDAEIIHATRGKKNLDDLMRYLYAEYAIKKDRGFTDQEFNEAVQKVCGKNMKSFMNEYVYDTKTPEYKETMKKISIQLNQKYQNKKILGLRTNLENGKTIVKYINSKSCSYLGGINVKDELISINGIAVKDNADDVLQALDDKNTALTVMVVRSGLLKEIRMDYHPLNYQDWSFIKPKETPLSKIFFRD